MTKAVTYYARWTEVYELVIDENGVLTGLTGTTPATIDVPATVTAFAANLFKGVTKITSATGGANVTKCGAGAFRDSGIWKAAPNGPVVVCGVLVGYKGTVPATLKKSKYPDDTCSSFFRHGQISSFLSRMFLQMRYMITAVTP